MAGAAAADEVYYSIDLAFIRGYANPNFKKVLSLTCKYTVYYTCNY